MRFFVCVHSFGPLPITEVDKRLAVVVQSENVQLTQDGKQALLKLCKGDMRRALNVLQVKYNSSLLRM